MNLCLQLLSLSLYFRIFLLIYLVIQLAWYHGSKAVLVYMSIPFPSSMSQVSLIVIIMSCTILLHHPIELNELKIWQPISPKLQNVDTYSFSEDDRTIFVFKFVINYNSDNIYYFKSQTTCTFLPLHIVILLKSCFYFMRADNRQIQCLFGKYWNCVSRPQFQTCLSSRGALEITTQGEQWEGGTFTVVCCFLGAKLRNLRCYLMVFFRIMFDECYSLFLLCLFYTTQ